MNKLVWTLRKRLRRLAHGIKALRPEPRVRHYLEIYEPGIRRVTVANFEANTPFAVVAVGDLLNTFTFPDAGPLAGGFLRVSKVEHIIWAFGRRHAHKVCIWTEPGRDPVQAPLDQDPKADTAPTVEREEIPS